MKLLLNLQNNRINLLKMIDLQLWELMYTLNRDIIDKYKLIRKTDTMIEYMFKFNSFSIFPAFYTHMIIHKVENKFTTQNVDTPDELKYNNCVKLSILSETVDIVGTDHCINIEINLELEEDSKILEPAIKNIFKKIFSRIKIYFESL